MGEIHILLHLYKSINKSMTDIIILSELFDYIVKTFGEDKLCLPLFIQNFTNGGSPPWAICSPTGTVGRLIVANGEFRIVDHPESAKHQTAITLILNKYKNKKLEADSKAADAILAKINKEHEFKFDEIIELSSGSTQWRDITHKQKPEWPGFIGLKPN